MSQRLYRDVSSGGNWPACTTPCLGVDVVDQQQLRAAAIQWNQHPESSTSRSWPVVSSHNNSWVLLG